MKTPASRFTFPYITVEQAVAYDPAKPETATASRVVNAVVEAFITVRPLTPRGIAEFVGVENATLAGAVKCATGLSTVKLLDEWRVQKILHLSPAERCLRSDEIACVLGFYDRSSLWQFMKRKRLIHLVRKGGWRDMALYDNPVFHTRKKRT